MHAQPPQHFDSETMGANHIKKTIQMERIEGRLSGEGLNSETRSKLEARLALLKKRTAARGERPGLTLRLADIDLKLEAIEAQRARLEQHKARLEARLAGEPHENEATAEKGDDPEAATPFPRLSHRLAKVEANLATATDPGLRGVLQNRANRLKRQLARKQQQVGGNGTMNRRDFPNLTQRLNRVLARLETVQDEDKRVQLGEKKAFLEMKILQKSLRKERKNCGGDNLAERAQELLGAGGPEAGEGVLGGATQEKNKGQQNEDMAVVPVEATAGMHPRRAKQKQRLIKMEAKARANKNPKALARVALQQVYVAYYPSHVNYVPLFDKGLLTQRAALRAQALKLAADRVSADDDGVDWIAEDMYEHLPEKWSLDDEIAMFEGGKENKFNENVTSATPHNVNQQQVGGNSNVNRRDFPRLTQRLNHVHARLETVKDEGKRTQLERKKAFLEMKILQKSLHKERKNCGGDNLAKRAQEPFGAGEPETAEGREGVPEEATQEKNKDQRNEDIVVVPAVTTGMQPRRAKQKQRLIKMEAKARANKNPKALARIALQQVYVAYYPSDVDYVPLFDEGLSIQRAAIRAQALKLAAIRVSANDGVDWIAEDMFAHLPEKWSLEDEIAMFGGGNENKPNKRGLDAAPHDGAQQQVGGNGNRRDFPHLTHRLNRVLARLETVKNEGKRMQLEKRKSFLETKILQKSLHKERKNCGGDNFVKCNQELSGAGGPETAEGVFGGSTQERDKNQNNQDMVIVPMTTDMHPRRAKQKQRLINMEKQARANKNPKALARVALQQVYVAYYPNHVDYVPLFDKDLLTQRAALRAQVLKLAAIPSADDGVDWIAEDMYEHLPKKWSLEDEIATFGGGKQTKSIEEGTIVALHDDEVKIAGDFVQLHLAEPPPGTSKKCMGTKLLDAEAGVGGDFVQLEPAEPPPQKSSDKGTDTKLHDTEVGVGGDFVQLHLVESLPETSKKDTGTKLSDAEASVGGDFVQLHLE